MDYQILPIEEQQVDAYLQISANAYPGIPMPPEKLKERILDTIQTDETVHHLGVFEQGQLLANMRLHDFRLNWHGQWISCGGIGGVAVDLLQKKKRICKQMVEFFIQKYQTEKAPLAVLYPFRPDFYYRMGFGYGAQIFEYKALPQAFPNFGHKEHLVFLQKEDISLLVDCFNEYAAKHHGVMQKNAKQFEGFFRSPYQRVIGYKKEDKLLGYMFLSFKKSHETNFTIHDMQLVEWIWNDLHAFEEFSSFLHSQADQVRRVIVTSYDPEFYHMLEDVRNDSDNMIPSVFHESNAAGVGVMYKIIDIEQFFALISQVRFPVPDLMVEVMIEDSFAQDSSFFLTIQQGKLLYRKEKEKDETPLCKIKMSIATFSSWVMGAITFETAWKYKRAQIDASQYVSILTDLFYSKQKPECYSWF